MHRLQAEGIRPSFPFGLMLSIGRLATILSLTTTVNNFFYTKPMKILIAVSVLLLGNFLTIADETNLFYITDDTHLFDPAGMRENMNPKKIEVAKTMRECLPAKDFPEGNWGDVQGGYQMSLRFGKSVFTNSESIMAILLLRNVTNNTVLYDALPVGYSDGPIGFEVTDSNGRNISQHLYTVGHIEGNQFVAGVVPLAQVKFLERLDKRFDLTNDSYSVQANVRVGDLVAKTIVMPILDSGGKWKPIRDNHGMVTNIYLAEHNPNPSNIHIVKSAKVRIQIESLH